MPICWTFAAYLLSLSSPHCGRPRPREVDWMTHYLLELSLLSKPAIVFSPSLVASAAVYMARFLFLDAETADPWPPALSVPSTHRWVRVSLHGPLPLPRRQNRRSLAAGTLRPLHAQVG